MATSKSDIVQKTVGNKLKAIASDSGELLNVKYVRRGCAARLTTVVKSARLFMNNKCNSHMIIQARENITSALNSLDISQKKYLNSFHDTDDTASAIQWYTDRKTIAGQCLLDIDNYLQTCDLSTKSSEHEHEHERENILHMSHKSESQTNSRHSSKSKSHSSASIHKLTLQTEQAKLRAKQLKQSAEIAEQAAALEMLKTQQAIRHETEMADLEVQVLQNMLERSSVNSQSSLKSNKPEYVRQWLNETQTFVSQIETQNKPDVPMNTQPKHDGVSHSTQNNPQNPILSQANLTTHQAQTSSSLNPHAPSFNSHVKFKTPDTENMKPSVHTRQDFHDSHVQSQSQAQHYQCEDEPIDAWIDRLVLGQETVPVLPSRTSNCDQLTQTLIHVESERDLPKIDLPQFNGAALMWPRFVEQFYSQVHCRPGISDTRRMDLLQSHLKGEAAGLVQGLGYSGKNYALALQELKNAFGHRVRISRAFLDKVITGPIIQSHDSGALRQFYVNIRDCVTTLEQLKYRSDLGSCDVLMKAARRLPGDKISSWNEHVKSVMKTREPTLVDLKQWLRERVNTDFNPYAVSVSKRQGSNTSNRTSVPNSQSHQEKSSERKSTMYTAVSITTPKQPSPTVESKTSVQTASQNTPKQPVNQAQTETQGKMPCLLCREAHYLYRCPLYANKTVRERWKLMIDNKLCINCLKPNHSAKRCFSSVSCLERDCSQKHHTSLHDDYSKPTRGTNHNIQSPDATRVYFQLVPVFAYGSNGLVIQTVALLDSASDISLIDDNLAKDLGLRGTKHSLSVKTLNSVTEREAQKVSLNIKAADDIDAGLLHIKEAWTVSSGAICCPPQHVHTEWEHIRDLNVSNIEPSEVKLLIGLNVPEAHLQTDVVSGPENQPYAVRTSLGWSLMGVSDHQDEREQAIQARVNFTVAQDMCLHKQVEQFWLTESFGVTRDYKGPSSSEDHRAQSILDKTSRLVDGHYEVGMLWRRDDLILPNNRGVAERRYRAIAKRLNHDGDFARLYSDTLNGYIAKGHAVKLTAEEAMTVSPRTWYIPHHGVTNINKPGKVRVVFDAAASHLGTSLNDNLMTGPDLLNNLFGVLVRFRQYDVGMSADIEGMFHQVKVSSGDSNALQFLWKEDLKQPGPPDVFKMTVHIFGAADSPCCANYALKRTATDNADQFSETTIQTALRDFYVDDLLTSVETSTDGMKLSAELIGLMKMGGFHLHKWMSNSAEVLNTIAESERAVGTVNLDLDEMPIQQALGLKWSISSDAFVFEQNPKDPVFTKRGVVSAVSSIFDPCGFLSPFTFRAKCLIQELWRNKLDWDDPLPPALRTKWEEWLSELHLLTSLEIPRHHLHLTGSSEHIELHFFSDASEHGFGAVAYLRYQSNSGIVCSFVAAKTHVAPLQPMLSIPRLELQGAVLAARLYVSLKNELTLNVTNTHSWTDSNTVLSYIKNEARRFKPFVSNRISEILEVTNGKQWRHVSSPENPADHCTRGLSGKQMNTSHSWFQGPQFLTQDENTWETQAETSSEYELSDMDPEVKKKHLLNTVSDNCKSPEYSRSIFKESELSGLINPASFSSWHRLCRRTAWMLRAVGNFLSKLKHRQVSPIKNLCLLPSEYEEAKLCWIKESQRDAFQSEMENLSHGNSIPAQSKLQPLTPFFDGRHLRVGGRLRKANIPAESKYQLLLPYDHHVTRLILHDVHVSIAHGGPEHVISTVRQKYWPINARRMAKQTIGSCLDCRRRRVVPSVPRMADLPSCRLNGAAGAFVNTGVDYFGPMLVKFRRCSVKRWGCLFTCLTTRAVHIELADSLETDSFILLLRCFIARRGHPHHIYSDNGTNFKGADNELSQCLSELKQQHICDFLAPQGIQWHFIPPLSPHFGGAWERLVRSTKTALMNTLRNTYVSETVLRTALTEVEAVLNSRPLTHNSQDPEDYTAITPNHFLIGRANNQLPPAVCTDREINSRKRWRQAQVIADHVCRRWLKEYLPELTVRNRWCRENPTLSVGDLVLLVADNQPRGSWELGRVCDVYPGDDGRIRTVKVKAKGGEYIRPAAKICLLEENISSE